MWKRKRKQVNFKVVEAEAEAASFKKVEAEALHAYAKAEAVKTHRIHVTDYNES